MPVYEGHQRKFGTWERWLGEKIISFFKATQSEQEAGDAENRIVTPGRQHYHNSSVKAWVHFDAGSGTPAIGDSYNLSSITDNGVGKFTLNWSVTFTNSSYALAGFGIAAITQLQNSGSDFTVTATKVMTKNVSATLTDFNDNSFIVIGELA